MSAERRTRLQQKFLDLVKVDSQLDLILLFDSSGSITSDDFNRAKRAATALVWKFGDQVSIGLAQFANNFQTECDITDQRDQVAVAVQSMIQIATGTAMHTALEGVGRMFEAHGRANAEKFLIIFTDGLPNDKNAALRQAELIRSRGIEVICIGIGRVDETYIRSVASADCSFLIDSYRDLLNQLPPTATLKTRKGIANSEIDVGLTLVGKPIAFIGASNPPKVKFTIEITNNGRVPIEAGSRITLIDDRPHPFFRKKIIAIPDAIPELETRDIDVIIDVCAGAKIGNIPEFLKITITNTKNAEYWNPAPESLLPIDMFVGDVFEWQLNPDLTTAKTANILCFGWNSAGKSTLINKILSLITNAARRLAAVRFGNQSTTTSVDEFFLENSPVKMMDSPGLAMDLYMNSEFAQLLAGLAPRNWSIDRPMTMPATEADRIEMPHSIIFVYPINSLDDTNSMAKMRQFIDSSIRDYHFHPILVLTFADYVPVEDHAERKRKAQSELGIIEADIYVLDNSDKNDERDTHVYRIVYEVLFKAMKYAEERMQQRG